MGGDESSWLPHNNNSNENDRIRNAAIPLPLKKNSVRAMHLNVEKRMFGSSSSTQLSSPATGDYDI